MNWEIHHIDPCSNGNIAKHEGVSHHNLLGFGEGTWKKGAKRELENRGRLEVLT
jgi:hypothetical protein